MTANPPPFYPCLRCSRNTTGDRNAYTYTLALPPITGEPIEYVKKRFYSCGPCTVELRRMGP
jgi:hypothetical protein